MCSYSNQKKIPSGWSKKNRKDLGLGIKQSEQPILSLGHLNCLSGALEHQLTNVQPIKIHSTARCTQVEQYTIVIG